VLVAGGRAGREHQRRPEASGKRYPLSPSRGNRRLEETSSGRSLPQWPCLLPSIVVGVAPLRNLTGTADRQGLVEDFTNHLVANLFRACRGFSFVWIAGEHRGRAWETLPAVERAMYLDRTNRRHSIWYCFGGFAELLLESTETAIALFRKSLELNAGFGSAQLFLMAALSLTGRQKEAASMAGSFRQQYPGYPANAFERLWLSRSTSPVYRAQVHPISERISAL
jgi:hypothetical protein